MSKHIKKSETYYCLVDREVPPELWHSTRGGYLVGAQSEKEAAKLLQKAIGFGHIQVKGKASEWCSFGNIQVGYGNVHLVVHDRDDGEGGTIWHTEPPIHATASRKPKEEQER